MKEPGQLPTAHELLIEAMRRMHARQYASALACLEAAFKALGPADPPGELEFFMGLCLDKLHIRADEAQQHTDAAKKILGQERFDTLITAWEERLNKFDRFLALCARSFPFPII